jgi:hypothetical protein
MLGGTHSDTENALSPATQFRRQAGEFAELNVQIAERRLRDRHGLGAREAVIQEGFTRERRV